MTNKEKYKILCETEGASIPLFLQYWWLEVVCQGKNWDVILAYGRDADRVDAALPYLIGSRLGMRYVLQPQLTQFSGPWFRPDVSRTENQRLEFEKQMSDILIAELEKLKLSYYQQNFSPSVTNWLPFYWAGYTQTTRYTYRIPDISDEISVFAHFDKGRRQKPINRLQNRYTPVEDITPEEFAVFHEEYWRSRGQKDLLTKDFIVRVIEASLKRKQGLLMGLKDEEGVLRAARFVVFDDRSAYSLLSALHPQHHENGTSPLLFWLLIKRLSGRTRAFDFEGSMDQGIEQSYRLYGALQTPYFQVAKRNSVLFDLLLRLKK